VHYGDAGTTTPTRSRVVSLQVHARSIQRGTDTRLFHGVATARRCDRTSGNAAQVLKGLTGGTYPFGRAKGIVPALELLAFWVVLALRLRASVELDIARVTVFRLVCGRKALVYGSRADRNRRF
jgi:hypothetical protein